MGVRKSYLYNLCIGKLAKNCGLQAVVIITFLELAKGYTTMKYYEEMLYNTPSSPTVQSGAPGEIESVTVKSIFRLKFQNIFGRSYRIFL